MTWLARRHQRTFSAKNRPLLSASLIIAGGYDSESLKSTGILDQMQSRKVQFMDRPGVDHLVDLSCRTKNAAGIVLALEWVAAKAIAWRILTK